MDLLPEQRSAVYYSQAKHFYDDESLSYTAAMARWASHYVTLILATIETHGFGMDMYKSYNAPLFAPASSPATVDGLTWIKTSDNGTTAVWDSSDGLQTCTFTYGTW